MLANKVALVTGSTSGIGRGAAVLLAKSGCAVTITGRKEKELEETKKLCPDASKVLSVAGDITNDDVLTKLVKETVATFGKLDILVNNAGFNTPESSFAANIVNFDKMTDVNVRSVIKLTQLCTPELVKTKGSIVNISSVASIRHNPIFTLYSMGKAALDSYTKCLAVGLGPQGVRVNSINPGYIDTNFAAAMGATKEMEEMYKVGVAAAAPLGRVGFPVDVAEAILYLVSDKSSFVTGQILVVDGGLTLGTPMRAPAPPAQK